MGENLQRVNEGLGSTADNLRGGLDAFFDFQSFLGWIGCHISGLFGGYDNLPLGSVCLG